MKKIDRLLMKAKRMYGGSGVIVAFINKIGSQWQVKGHFKNGELAYNLNELHSQEEAEECLEALLEKHNADSIAPCIVFTGEEELED